MPAEKSTILFLCQYGGAKSVIAASYFNRLAEEQQLPYAAIAAAAEQAYEAVPPPVTALLASEGFDVGAFKPRRVADGEMKAAAKVVSIDCNLADEDVAGATLERWDDVPKVSDGLQVAAAAIRQHVEALVAALNRR